MLKLADRVRTRREELNMSQEELAHKMGYKNRSSINKIENGRQVTQKIIARLAEALDVSVPYLMGWDDEPEDVGALAAQVLLEPGLMQMVQDYLALEELDRQTVRSLVASMAAKTKKD